jgi:dethiobiotin synthetase
MVSVNKSCINHYVLVAKLIILPMITLRGVILHCTYVTRFTCVLLRTCLIPVSVLLLRLSLVS